MNSGVVAPPRIDKAFTTQVSGSSAFTSAVGYFLDDQENGSDPDRPQAFLNWILFDEQFNMIASSSGYDQVPDESEYNNDNIPDNNVYNHIATDIPMNANGYLYVYVSNQTNNINVYFDNLQVTHVRGSLTEETHYYPYGLPMAGISSKAAGGKKVKQKYNGKEEQRQEFADGTGLEWTDYGARMYDNQIGRWLVQDPKSDKYSFITPYVYALNNPIIYIDPDGLDIIVAFTGGFRGEGKTISPNSEDAASTGRIVTEIQQFAEKMDIDLDSRVILSGATSGTSVNNAVEFIKANYEKGEKIIIYGYSYGGDFAVELCKELKELNISVDLLVIVDASDGPLKNITVDDEVPDNVKEAVNFYQVNTSGKSSASQKSGDGSGSDSGPLDSPGSRGSYKTAEDSKKTKLTNYRVLDEQVTHANLPDLAHPFIVKMIEAVMLNCKTEPIPERKKQ